MTNAPDFNLSDALDATRGWDDDSIELDDDLLEDDDDFESGYADETTYDDEDPEELTLGAQELAERHALRRVARADRPHALRQRGDQRRLRCGQRVRAGAGHAGERAGAAAALTTCRRELSERGLG